MEDIRPSYLKQRGLHKKTTEEWDLVTPINSANQEELSDVNGKELLPSDAIQVGWSGKKSEAERVQFSDAYLEGFPETESEVKKDRPERMPRKKNRPERMSGREVIVQQERLPGKEEEGVVYPSTVDQERQFRQPRKKSGEKGQLD